MSIGGEARPRESDCLGRLPLRHPQTDRKDGFSRRDFEELLHDGNAVRLENIPSHLEVSTAKAEIGLMVVLLVIGSVVEAPCQAFLSGNLETETDKWCIVCWISHHQANSSKGVCRRLRIIQRSHMAKVVLVLDVRIAIGIREDAAVPDLVFGIQDADFWITLAGRLGLAPVSGVDMMPSLCGRDDW